MIDLLVDAEPHLIGCFGTDDDIGAAVFREVQARSCRIAMRDCIPLRYRVFHTPIVAVSIFVRVGAGEDGCGPVSQPHSASM